MKSTWIVRKGIENFKASDDIKSVLSRSTFRDDGTHSSYSDTNLTFLKVKNNKQKQDLHEIRTVTEQEVEDENEAPVLTPIVSAKFKIVKKEVKPKNEDPRLHAVFDRNAFGTNAFTDLGGGIIESSRGKAQVMGARSKKTANVNEYFDFKKDLELPLTSNQQDYPAYEPD